MIEHVTTSGVFSLDGQDFDAALGTVGDADARARAGEGPTLLEMQPYR